jgi:hypothetical protein
MYDKRNAYSVLAGMPKGNISLRRYTRKCVGDTGMEMGRRGVD